MRMTLAVLSATSRLSSTTSTRRPAGDGGASVFAVGRALACAAAAGPLVAGRPAGLDRCGDDLRDVDSLELELDLAARDPRHVEQIIDKAHQLLQLARDELPRPRELARVVAADPHDMHGVADRCKRVAQF